MAEATSLREASGEALEVLRRTFGWAYGCAFRVAEEGLELEVDRGPHLQDLERTDRGLVRRAAEALAERALQEDVVVFVEALDGLLDEPVTTRTGLASGVALPVHFEGAIAGVATLFTAEPIALSDARRETLAQASRIVGQTFERIAAERAERAAAEELQRKVEEILESVRAAADGDLTKPIAISGEDAIGQLGEGIARWVESLRASLNTIAEGTTSVGGSADELENIAQSMAANAEETSQQAVVVSEAADQVSTNVQTVAAGMEELNVSIGEIAKSAKQAAQVALEGVEAAQTTNTTVTQLGQSSAEIGKVVKTITGIAQQTNLLALNATIEAARAGEAGRGFAVVANEVKELAKETAKATDDISDKIEAIQRDSSGAVEAIAYIGEVIGQINDLQTTIASAVEQQGSVTYEIGRSLTDAARGSTEIASNISGVAEAARSTAEGAANTQRSSTDLGSLARRLQELVDRFEL
jgi:methyl-accepting chemotaxis protein